MFLWHFPDYQLLELFALSLSLCHSIAFSRSLSPYLVFHYIYFSFFLNFFSISPSKYMYRTLSLRPNANNLCTLSINIYCSRQTKETVSLMSSSNVQKSSSEWTHLFWVGESENSLGFYLTLVLNLFFSCF